MATHQSQDKKPKQQPGTGALGASSAAQLAGCTDDAQAEHSMPIFTAVHPKSCSPHPPAPLGTETAGTQPKLGGL